MGGSAHKCKRRSIDDDDDDNDYDHGDVRDVRLRSTHVCLCVCVVFVGLGGSAQLHRPLARTRIYAASPVTAV